MGNPGTPRPHLAPHRFLPGQSGNYSGRKKLPEHLRFVDKFTNEEIKAMVSMYLRMDSETMGNKLKAKDTPQADKAIISLIQEIIEKGCHSRLEYLLARAGCKISKVEDEIEVEVGNALDAAIDNLSEDEQLEVLNKLRKV